MIGVIVNTITVLIGSTVGLIFKRGIPEKLSDAIMMGIGLCTVCIGVSGIVDGADVIILIVSMVLGAIFGTIIDLDAKITALGDWLSKKFKDKSNTRVSVTEGFVTACLMFCVGSMTIVGSLNSGLRGDHQMIFTKSLLDLISSTMLAASLGIGVLFSSAFVFGFQGLLVILAQYIAPFLSQTSITQINCVGSLLIFALGLNILGITKIKVANYLPAVVVAPLVMLFAETIAVFFK